MMSIGNERQSSSIRLNYYCKDNSELLVATRL